MTSRRAGAESGDQSLRNKAHEALDMLDSRLQRNFFGVVEGVDTVHLALNALASALARLSDFPLDRAEAPDITDVLAYLVSKNQMEPDALRRLAKVREGIRQSTYEGMPEAELEAVDDAREELYEHFREYLSGDEQDASSA